MPRKKKEYKFAALDIETDPFKFGRVPQPFAIEFYSDEITEVFWQTNNPKKLTTDCLNFLEALPDDYIIYAHNGGKFDFHFLHDAIENPLKIIKSRIVSAKLFRHTLRDSYAILPVPLAAFGGKQEIDYSKMELAVREKHRTEILEYLHTDCVELLHKVRAFIDQFGLQLTIGKTAITEIEKRHTFSKIEPHEDAVFRPFYFGGRVQCFKHGLIEGPFKLLDLNSAYPKVMRDCKHPVNGNYEISNQMPDDFEMPFFLHFRGKNRGALPTKSGDGLSFEQTNGEFFACSHEIEVALKYDLIEIDEVLECYQALETISFVKYVDDFYTQRLLAKANGDKVGEIFAKLLLNSGYGKFGQNPDNFQDWIINRSAAGGIELEKKGYALEADMETFELWAKPAAIKDSAYFDVAIAASITSACRALLLEGIQHAIDPIYCDTDSLLCRDFRGEIDAKKLGAWKLETEAPRAAIGGKKLYALYNKEKTEKRDGKTVNPIKLVSKGGTLSLEQLLTVCRGESAYSENIAPTFSLMKRPALFIQNPEHAEKDKLFIRRKFKMTVDK